MDATAQVDVADAVAALDETLDGLVGDLAAVAEVHVMQVLAQAGDGKHGGVGDVTALGEHEVAQARGDIDDLLDRSVGEPDARGEVEDAQVFVDAGRRQGQEGGVLDELAAGESQLAQGLAPGQQVGNRLVTNQPALVQVDLEYVWAVLGKGHDGVVGELGAVIELQLW